MPVGASREIGDTPCRCACVLCATSLLCAPTLLSSGWTLIPTYVGLQAPCTTSSKPARIDPLNAASQGRAAADDAVANAGPLGIGVGSAIYFDMEAYADDAACRQAVLTFLSNWTTRLHELAYLSGVYSSASSGIRDLVGVYDSPGFTHPDHVWSARWDGVATTSDPVIPATFWPSHQRLKQYLGDHDESYGGVTINIDNDYLDGAVVGIASPPQLRIKCRSIVFTHRPRSGAFKVRAFGLPRCGTPRRVALATKNSRFGASGEARAYRKAQFSCRGQEAGRARVVYECRSTDAKIRFVRRGLTP